jgi:hypothetical protein
MLRSTWRGLETWHGRDGVTLADERARQQGTQTSAYTGAPVLDPTCVQRRLACSAGVRPAGARVRRPVVWIAGWRETKTLKPIDKVSLGEITPGRNDSERASGLENEWFRGPSLQPKGEGSMGCRNLTDAAPLPRRGGSDSTVARTCQATGEALLAPVRNHRSRVDRITGTTGKSIDGERVADGSV